MRNDRQLKFLAVAVFIVMMLVAAVPFWTDRSVDRMLDASRAGLERRQRLELVVSLLRDAETAQRGFVITGNDAFLQASLKAQQALPQALQALKRASRSDDDRAVVWRISRLAQLKQAAIGEAITVRQNEGAAAAAAVVGSMRGMHHMDELRRIVQAEVAAIDQRLQALSAELQARTGRSFAVSVGATLLNVCVLAALLVVLMRMLRERRESARLLGERAAELAVAAGLATRHNRELRLTAEMLRAAEAAPSSREAGPVIGRYLPRLLPELSGSFYLLRDDDGMLERQGAWGDPAGPMADEPAELAPESCRALQNSARYKTCGDQDLPCTHDRTGLHGATVRLCVPLVSQDDLVGMIHLRGLASDPQRQQQQEQLAVAVAEQLALALGNARLRESLRRQSVLDALTGLFNRRYFDETMKRELARARRSGLPMALLVLDIDHFKQVNDRYGHAAGDVVLRNIAGQIRSWIREGDVACRYGGEEFVILMPECGAGVARERADMLRQAIAATVFSSDGSGPERVTASFGVAELPRHGEEADALFRAADTALYRAKHLGRNQVVTAGDAA